MVAWSGSGEGDTTGVFARGFDRPLAVPPPAPLIASSSALAAIDELFADDDDLLEIPIKSLLF